jgi:hypothetical protein
MERGDFMRASNSATFALGFSSDNMGALAIRAEIYFQWEDRICSYYAQQALNYQRPKTGQLGALLSDPQTLEYHQFLRNRMNAIIRESAEHQDWRDSYQLKMQAGLLEPENGSEMEKNEQEQIEELYDAWQQSGKDGLATAFHELQEKLKRKE